MSRYRISVEWGIGVIKEKWKLLKTKVNLARLFALELFILASHDGLQESCWPVLVQRGILD